MDTATKKDESFWKEKLTPEQYAIMRQKGTEAPGTGALLHTKEDGMYHCAGCGASLFSSDKKFDSGSGWPSFTDAEKANVAYVEDHSHGMARTEIVCKQCGAHLGHVFDDGPTPTCKRFCVNSVSIDFKPTS